MLFRFPNNLTPYDDRFENEPGQRWFFQWVLGGFVPLLLFAWGISAIATRQASYWQDRIELPLFGLNAQAYGLTLLSVGAFLHFRYFWGSIFGQLWWTDLGKLLAGISFIVSLVFIIIRVGVLGAH